MSQNLNSLHVFWINQVQMREFTRKVASERRVVGVSRPLVYARSLQLQCSRVVYESLLVPVLMYGSETMIWREGAYD